MFQRPERKTLLLLSAAVLVLALTCVVVVVISAVGISTDDAADDVTCAPYEECNQRPTAQEAEAARLSDGLFSPVRFSPVFVPNTISFWQFMMVFGGLEIFSICTK